MRSDFDPDPDAIPSSHLLSIAPMMDCTDRHYRFLARQMSRHVQLYTEMVVDQAILHNQKFVLPPAEPYEHPITVQLGGSDPAQLAKAAVICERLGYDEINLNVGCPSPKVVNKKDSSSCFGARLMLDPDLVGNCVKAMQDVVSIPVTVKCRIGVDDRGEYEHLVEFIQTVTRIAGPKLRHFIVHARIALLNGLSPHENRMIPPLRYADVYRLKQEFPELSISINGGLQTHEDVKAHLAHVDGAMIGRMYYKHPWLLSTADSTLFRCPDPALSRRQVILAYADYAQRQTRLEAAQGIQPKFILNLVQVMIKPLPQMLYNTPRGEKWLRKALMAALAAWRAHPPAPADLRATGVPITAAVREALDKIGTRELDDPPGYVWTAERADGGDGGSGEGTRAAGAAGPPAAPAGCGAVEAADGGRVRASEPGESSGSAEAAPHAQSETRDRGQHSELPKCRVGVNHEDERSRAADCETLGIAKQTSASNHSMVSGGTAWFQGGDMRAAGLVAAAGLAAAAGLCLMRVVAAKKN